MTVEPDAAPPASSNEPRRAMRWYDVFLSLLAASGFALAQPMFDLLAENAEFFLFRGSPGSDIALLALGLTFGIPIVVTLLWTVGRRARAGVGTAIHATALTLLLAAFALPILKRIESLDEAPGPVALGLAALLGALVTALVYRAQAMRLFLRFGAAASVGFAGLFLFASPASALLFPAEGSAAAGGAVKDPAPIVMIVFDEFPVASLMGADRRIDPGLYPAFARLAREGTWFRNATTPHDFTTWAVPAMLTGKAPSREWRVPSLHSHPDNLFTLLGDRYDMRVDQAITRLCPAEQCPAAATETQPFGPRWQGILSDLRVVLGHLYLPARYRGGLPPVDETVGGFAHSDVGDRRDFAEVLGDRDAAMERLVDGIRRDARPTLRFLHVLYPHKPWVTLPSGQRYTEITLPARAHRGWTDDEWLVHQAWQQHLLQVAAADRYVGRVIAALEEAGTYDRTMVVVAADHGISFRPGIERSRFLDAGNVGEIAAVPLFVKLPGSSRTGIDDRRVSTLDVLPTIAEAIGVEIPWKVDGVSLFGARPAVRQTTTCSASKECVTYGVDGREKYAVVRQKLAVFGGGDPFRFAYPGHEDLLGDRVADHAVADGTATARIARAERFRDVDPRARILPVLVRGTLSPAPPDRVVLAIAVNGRIVAVTRSYSDAGDESFYAIIPPSSLRRGVNDVRVYEIDRSAGTVLELLA